MDDKTVVLRVQLDEGATEQQLKKLVLDLEATRKAQQALTAERKAGTKSDEEFAAETVKLQQQLKSQQGEYANLTKNLDLYRKAQAGEMGNYQATQAALSLAIRQQHELAGSADDSTEASQALTKQIAEYREQLAQTDERQKLFARRIGDYGRGSAGLQELAQQLALLQEQQKKTVAGTKENEDVTRRIGFVQTAAAQAGAKAGLSYEQTTAKVEQYSEALRPAAAALVKLEQAEEEATAAGKATGDSMQRIGFQTAAARKALDDATKSLDKVPEAAEQSKESTDHFGGALLDAAGSSDLLGGAIEKARGAQEFFSKAQVAAKAATLGNASAFQVLKLALISTGLGALVVVLGLLITGLLKSQTATDFLSRKMAALGGFIQPIINLGAELAEKLVAAAENPKQAFSELVDFIEQNLIARIKGFGVILDAIRNRDLGKLVDGVVQLGTGITDATAKATALVTEMGKSGKAAEAIEKETQRIREAERALNVERDQSRARIEGLKKLSDDTTKTIATRTAAAKEAAAVENGLLSRQLKLQDDKIRNLRAEQSLKQSLTTEDKNALAELQSERAKVAQESLTLQTELQNKLNSLVSESIDKRIERRAQELAVEAQQTEARLRLVQRNSDEELSLLQSKLRNSYQAELNAKNLTVKQKQAFDLKYETESSKLAEDFNKARILAAYDAELAGVSARLALAERGSQQETELKVAAIEVQLTKQLAALDRQADNEARAAELRAQADRQIQDTRYSQAAAATEAFIQGERNALDEQLAAGKLSQAAYDKAVLDADVQNAQMRVAVARGFGQQTDQLEQRFTEAKIAKLKSVTDAERAEQQKRMELAESLTTSLVGLFQETVATTGATLEDFLQSAFLLLVESVEKAIIAEQIKVIVQAFSSKESLATYGVLGFVKSAAIIAASTLATAALKSQLTPPQRQFARGGRLVGDTHAAGGIPFTVGGVPGFEAEHNEVLLTRGVWESPVLRPIASWLNVAGGGAPLAPRAHLALGGVASMGAGLNAITRPAAVAYVQQQAGGLPIDYDRLAQALSRLQVKATISDVEAGLERRKETKRLSNS